MLSSSADPFSWNPPLRKTHSEPHRPRTPTSPGVDKRPLVKSSTLPPGPPPPPPLPPPPSPHSPISPTSRSHKMHFFEGFRNTLRSRSRSEQPNNVNVNNVSTDEEGSNSIGGGSGGSRSPMPRRWSETGGGHSLSVSTLISKFALEFGNASVERRLI